MHFSRKGFNEVAEEAPRDDEALTIVASRHDCFQFNSRNAKQRPAHKDGGKGQPPSKNRVASRTFAQPHFVFVSSHWKRANTDISAARGSTKKVLKLRAATKKNSKYRDLKVWVLFVYSKKMQKTSTYTQGRLNATTLP